MLRGWLIYSQYESTRNNFFVNELISNAKKSNIQLDLIIKEHIISKIDVKPKIYYTGKELQIPNFAIVRANDFTLSFQLEKMGIKVFNDSQTSLICNNKYLTYCFASSLGIPTLDTFLIDKSVPEWQDIDAKLFPLVAKPLDLKGGENVVLLQNKDEFIKNSNIFDNKFLLQKPAQNLGEDVRVYLLDKKIIAAAKRKSTTDFRSNFCLGGSATIVKPNLQQLEIKEKVINNIDAHYVGMDFLFSNDSVYLN